MIDWDRRTEKDCPSIRAPVGAKKGYFKIESVIFTAMLFILSWVYCCSKCSNRRELHKPISPSGVPSLLSRLTLPEASGHVISAGPITGQCSGHVISSGQSQLSGLVTSSLRALGSRSCPGPGAGDAHCQGILQRISKLILAQNWSIINHDQSQTMI